MTSRKQVEALSDDLARVLNRYRMEFDLSLAEVVGVLEVLKLEMVALEMEEGE